MSNEQALRDALQAVEGKLGSPSVHCGHVTFAETEEWPSVDLNVRMSANRVISTPISRWINAAANTATIRALLDELDELRAKQALALPTAAPVDERELPLLPEPDWYMVHTPGADFDWSFTKDRSEALELSRQSDGLPDVSKITSYYAGNRVLDYARASLQSVADAVLAEREACAKVCDNLTSEWTPEECAAAIRARGTATIPLLSDDEMPPLPEPTYIYHDADEDGEDDLFDFAKSGAVDEGCPKCKRLYTADQLRARDRAVEAAVRKQMGVV